MGNAPLCQACHTDKGVRLQGNIQDVEKFTDYYGCNSEDSKDPEAVVSLKKVQQLEKQNHVIVNTCVKTALSSISLNLLGQLVATLSNGSISTFKLLQGQCQLSGYELMWGEIWCCAKWYVGFWCISKEVRLQIAVDVTKYCKEIGTMFIGETLELINYRHYLVQVMYSTWQRKNDH